MTTSDHEVNSTMQLSPPVCATTHTDIMIRAKSIGVEVEVIHNASVMGAVGSCGLQLYNFGQTVLCRYTNQRKLRHLHPIVTSEDKGHYLTVCKIQFK